MRVIRWALSVLVVVAVGVLGYGWQFGGWRIQRDAGTFADHVMTCRPFEQSYPVPRVGNLSRSVLGEEDGRCRVLMDALGGGPIACSLDQDQRAVLAEGIRNLATDVDFFGYPTAVRISTSNPDPMAVLLNGPACSAG